MIKNSINLLKRHRAMKLKFNPFHCPASLVATVALLLAALPAAQAANGTWTGGTSTVWDTTANWLGGTVAGSTSANADIATFNSGTYLNSPTAASNYFLGGLSFGGSNGAITITTGSNISRLNVGSGGIQVASGSSGAVTLGATGAQGINLTASQSWMNNSTSLLTINRAAVDDAAALGTYTVTINGSGSGGVRVLASLHDSTVNGKDPNRNVAVIINSTGGAANFNTGSTYSGGTTLTAGLLQIGADASGSVGAITSSTTGTGGLALNGGTLSSGSTTARTILNAITIGGDVTLGDATNIGALTFSADAAIGSSTRTLTTASAATFSGNITGTGGITKAGSGALTYNGTSANTYSGLTTVGAGSLTLAKTAGNAIAGNLLVNGGDVSVTVAGTQIADTATVEVSSGNFTIGTGLNETVATVKLTGGNIIGGDATSTLTATTTFDLQSGTNTAILAGTGNATKSTSGTILLSKANTYSGGTTLTAGTLQIGVASAGAVGAITSSAIGTGGLALNGGTLSSGSTTARTILNAITIGGDVTLGDATNTGALSFSADANLGGATRTLTTATGSSATFNGIVSNGGIIKNGNGTLIMGTAESTYSGGTTLNAGTLSFGTTRNGSVGNITSSSLGTGSLTLNGGTLTGSSSATRAILNALTIGGDVTFGDGVNNGILNFSAGVDLGGATRTLTIANSSVSFNGVVANGGLTKAGNTLVLTGNNTYTGATTISSGTLQIGNGGAVGSIDSTSSVNNNGALIYNRNNSFTAGYAIGGTGTLEKQGAGTLTLTGSNTYTGGTKVSTGTLLVNNTSGSGTGSGSLLVSAGATLGGSGEIAGITTISGILAPGNSIGTLTVANDVTWNGSLLSDGTANWKFELGAANTADLLRITGGASEFIKGSGSVFCFDFLGSTETGTFTLVDWDSTAFVGGGFVGTSFAATDFTYTNLGNSNTGTFQFNGSQLQFQSIPEPSAGVLMVLAGTALFVLRRRRMQ